MRGSLPARSGAEREDPRERGLSLERHFGARHNLPWLPAGRWLVAALRGCPGAFLFLAGLPDSPLPHHALVSGQPERQPEEHAAGQGCDVGDAVDRAEVGREVVKVGQNPRALLYALPGAFGTASSTAPRARLVICSITHVKCFPLRWG